MSMMSDQRPNREYSTRPPDERFPTLQALIDASRIEKAASRDVTYNAKDLRFTADDDQVKIVSPRGKMAGFTNWGFNQAASFAGAPASYLANDLTPQLAADCLNHGYQTTPDGRDAVLLVTGKADGTQTVRSVTTKTYARLWECDFLPAVQSTILDQDHSWGSAPTWTGESAGFYKGDRDSFVIVVNGGSIVTDPSARNGNGQMYRGLMFRNSLVGLCSWTYEAIWMRAICGNHTLLGAMMGQQYRRRHVGADSLTRDVIRQISRLAYEMTTQSAARDESIIRLLVDREIAQTKESVISELRALGATKEVAEQAYDRTEQTELASPRSFWGLANGLTRLSQDSGFQDGRYELDQIAGRLLAKGRQLVAA